ncbi:hypothetical protein HRR99_06035 [Agrobacterium vaccinii]|uniref:T3SS effector HopA1 family protein n=1 Tax=Agrobacterium vaccinii TaxID=2735528 RepID=UPI001E51F524|nr:T3SS effector HopA1 family protein [Agrobacterium vaccinii]UHS61104.1 hypothetical protein HRR99_06035 [Agrobacterium vaccinii]
MNAIDRTFVATRTQPITLPTQLQPSLADILGAVKIINLGQFRIGNRPVVTLPPAAPSEPPKPVTTRLSEALWPALYDAAYARPFTPDPPAPKNMATDVDLLSQLRAAFPEGSRWSQQWQVYKTDASGAIHVRKGDCCRHVLPGAFTLSSPGPVQVNSNVSILLPLASSQVQSAFYHITGHVPHCDHDDAALARLYLNTRPETVVSLMALLAGLLNGYAVPFRAKTLLDPSTYDRTDSTVFYLARRHLPFMLALLRDAFVETAPDIGADVPLFSKSLTGGVGGADDPGYGMSFGQVRTMLMADAIVRAWAAGSQSVETRLDYLEKRFAEAGLSLTAPHLSAGNSDLYTYPV